jgi:hypothetical protein
MLPFFIFHSEVYVDGKSLPLVLTIDADEQLSIFAAVASIHVYNAKSLKMNKLLD